MDKDRTVSGKAGKFLSLDFNIKIRQRLKGAKNMVTEEDLTLGGGHTMQYTAHVS